MEHVLRPWPTWTPGSSTPSGHPPATNSSTGATLPAQGGHRAGLPPPHGPGLEPEEFSGGEAPGQANFVLRELGFAIEAIQEGVGGSDLPSADAFPDAVGLERARRMGMWRAVLDAGGPNGVPPSLLRDLGIYGGAQGIWVDKARTGQVTQGGEGVTVGVLHTGSSYADDLADDCMIYHYPKTRRAGRDPSEVEATKAVEAVESAVLRDHLPDAPSSRA